MIRPPSNWSAIEVAGSLLLTPNVDPERMAIRYSDNLWPRRCVAELARDRLTEPEQTLADLDIHSIDDLVTDEGEFAAMVTASGRIDGTAVCCAVGFVLFDRWYARISGLTIDSAAASELERVVRTALFGTEFLLGVRPRRYRHCILEAWRAHSGPGLQRQLVAPNRDAVIETWPAMPTSGASAESLLARNGTATSTITPLTVGVLEGLSQDSKHTRLAVLSDGRYLYAAQITHRTPRARNDAAFDALCRSIAPLPAKQHGTRSQAAMGHWAA